jgi:hypothetical protein
MKTLFFATILIASARGSLLALIPAAVLAVLAFIAILEPTDRSVLA